MTNDFEPLPTPEVRTTGSLHPVVQPHGLSWHVCHPTETTTATQLRLGEFKVLGLYWHLEKGFKLTNGRSTHATEVEAQKATLHSAIQKRLKELKVLEAELVRLNAEIRRGDLGAPINPQSESPSPASNG